MSDAGNYPVQDGPEWKVSAEDASNSYFAQSDAPRPRGKMRAGKPWREEVREMIEAAIAEHVRADHSYAAPRGVALHPITATTADVWGYPSTYRWVEDDEPLPAPAPRSWFRRLLDRLEAAAL